MRLYLCGMLSPFLLLYTCVWILPLLLPVTRSQVLPLPNTLPIVPSGNIVYDQNGVPRPNTYMLPVPYRNSRSLIDNNRNYYYYNEAPPRP
ncbi:hypothetical protein HMI54_003591, partial [Coelomomyces lativittatus]